MFIFVEKLRLESLFSRLLTASHVHKILLHTQKIFQRSAEKCFSVQEYQLVKKTDKHIKRVSGNSSQNCSFTFLCSAISKIDF